MSLNIFRPRFLTPFKRLIKCEDFLVIRRNAGHSKWQNIKHVKAEKDLQRSQLFIRLCQKIKVAIQENGNNANPTTNYQLSQAIDVAKSNDMPVSSIQACIKNTQTNQEGASLYRYYVKGPKGSILMVTVLTNAVKKTRSDILHILKKVGGNMSDISLEGQFDKKGIILAVPPAGLKNIEEVSVDHAIEAGAEEVVEENDKLKFSCEVSQLHKAKTTLQELKYSVEEAKITFIPKLSRVSLSDDEMELMSKIIDRLEEHPEVVDIVDNIE